MDLGTSDISVGVTIFMPNCSFQAEIVRDAITETINEIDLDLTNKGFTSTDQTNRILNVMTYIIGISALVAKGEIDQEDGISEIAFGFMYAYVKEQGSGDIATLRGLIGCLVNNKLYLTPCMNNESYEKATNIIRESAQELIGYDDMIDKTPKKPTIH